VAHNAIAISPAHARAIWLRAQGLDSEASFGEGPAAVNRVVEHLGYVQIDTINVIERSHHHIAYTRIPAYRKTDLEQAQSVDKSVFEYWTHALAYVPISAYRYFVPAMDRMRKQPNRGYASIDAKDYRALLRRIRDEGPLSIRDIDDDVLVEKTHPWDSRKPSRRIMRFGFYCGDLAVSKRVGMVKAYDLSKRHFGWRARPRPATESQYAAYLLARAVRAQGVVSLDSICYGDVGFKKQVLALCEAAVRRKRLLPVVIQGSEQVRHWADPALLDTVDASAPHHPRVHILSPFDPLIIQRKRLKLLFGYEHRFEAYVPPEKRVLGYFALPVLADGEIVAAVDLKMDRQAGKLLEKKWTWCVRPRAGLKARIDDALQAFERFHRA
jgi:uncharacterized protein YcaQ